MILKEDYKKKFKRCILEYTNASEGYMQEAGEDPMGGGTPMGGDPGMGGDAPMGGDPSMGGAPMGGDSEMGGDPSMGGAPMGGDPNAEVSPEGFAPQGVDPNAGLDGMGGDPNMQQQGSNMPQDPNMGGEDEEVIDVDDLTNSQEKTEKKIDALASKFEKLLGSLDSIEKRIDSIDTHTNEYLGSLKGEIEKRNPTPMQRLTMRSTKSAPYEMTPNEYMNNYAPENYSAESDENGADDPQYKITKADIDNFTDYNSIAKEFDGKMGLRDILNF